MMALQSNIKLFNEIPVVQEQYLDKIGLEQRSDRQQEELVGQAAPIQGMLSKNVPVVMESEFTIATTGDQDDEDFAEEELELEEQLKRLQAEKEGRRKAAEEKRRKEQEEEEKRKQEDEEEKERRRKEAEERQR